MRQSTPGLRLSVIRFIGCKIKDKNPSVKASNKYSINSQNSRCRIKYLIMSVVWKNTLEGDSVQQLDAFAGQSVGKTVWAARSHALQMCPCGRQDRAARGISCGPHSRALAGTPLHRCVKKRGETGTPDATQERLVPSSNGILHKSLLVQKPSKQISQEVSEKPTFSDAIRSQTITTSSTHTPQ